MTTLPTIDLERELLLTGKSCVIGLDEVGKGAWAGPLVIGAAVLTREVIDAQNAPELMGGARDSKQLSESKREAMFDHVAATCKTWAVGAATHEECDRLGMNKAQKLATKRALEHLGKVVDLKTAAAEGIRAAETGMNLVAPGSVFLNPLFDAAASSVESGNTKAFKNLAKPKKLLQKEAWAGVSYATDKAEVGFLDPYIRGGFESARHGNIKHLADNSFS